MYPKTNLSTVPKLPGDDWQNENGNANVRSDKVRGVPVALQEDREASHQSDDGGTNETNPGGIWLEGSLPGKRVP